MKYQYKWIFLLFLLPLKLFADINSDLQNYFNALGFRNNVVNPDIYLGQEGGFYQGGSLFLRSGIQETPLTSFQLPSYRAGCGGIDLYTGAFSFINGKQFEILMRNIINNAEGFAFELAMETMSPMIAEQMKHLQSLINTINQQNINSCEMGTALVGSVWPKTQLSQQHVCEMVGKSTNIFSDWTAARMGCSSDEQREAVFQSGKQKAAFQSMIAVNTNLAWEALKKNHLFSADSALAEFMMTLSGTIIITNEKYFHLMPKVANAKTIQALLYGGDVNIYHCDTQDNCLSPYETTIHITENTSFQRTMRNLLQKIVEHIRLDEPLNEQEMSLLNSTALPIYKILLVQIAYTNSMPFIDLDKYADVIAIELLNHYVEEMFSLILQATHQFQMGDAVVEEYKKQIHESMYQLQKLQSDALKKIGNVNNTIEMTRVLEQELAGRLSGELHP